MLIVYLLCFCLVSLTAFSALPAEVRSLILDNCRNSQGRLRPRYVAREMLSVARFYAQMLFAASLVACVVLIAAVWIDDYIKLQLIAEALEKFEPDAAAWEENLKAGPNSVSSQFTQHHMMQGGTQAGAKMLMWTLWRLVPVATVLVFAGMLLYLRLMSQSFNRALRDLVREESARDLRRIRRRYLQNTAQSQRPG
ncbi:hypothetical protein Enr13x_59470 [Stieleria neptunia]|uniref:Uncharacterized protein n=1 Tax=Stieleria neptunia TaxID=2527979 RepID=A0A518HYW6_9BACT|nr:hypothetical protein [Stieleria neptunia]QDV46043.1 hypothetical protein Enr13x_59470 [Stieleria neptunia]